MLIAFQLRAARSVLGIGVREVGEYLNISRTMISIWEHQSNLDEIHSKTKNIQDLKSFFEARDIIFPDNRSIALKVPENLISSRNNSLTRFQLRAARSATGLTQIEMAQYTGITHQTLNYLEKLKNTLNLNTIPKEFNEFLILDFFHQHGIKFPNNFTVLLERDPKIQLQS